jgi:hypothetical protein
MRGNAMQSEELTRERIAFARKLKRIKDTKQPLIYFDEVSQIKITLMF